MKADLARNPFRRVQPHERTDDNLRAAIAVCRKYPDNKYLRRELVPLLAELAIRERRQ